MNIANMSYTMIKGIKPSLYALTLRASTPQGLTLSCKNFTRRFLRKVSLKLRAKFSIARDLLIIYCDEQFFGTVKSPRVEISRDWVISKRFLHTIFKILSVQISWRDFFVKKIIIRTWSFLHECKTTNLGVILSIKS